MTNQATAQGFTPLFDWLDDVDGLTVGSKRLYGVLWRMRRSDGTCCVNTRKLAAVSKSEQRTVTRRLRALETAGLIRVDRSGGIVGKPNTYTFLKHPEAP